MILRTKISSASNHTIEERLKISTSNFLDCHFGYYLYFSIFFPALCHHPVFLSYKLSNVIEKRCKNGPIEDELGSKNVIKSRSS